MMLVDPILDIKVEMPAHLAEISKREKVATPMSKEFHDFKAYLLM